jgi:hypothetical protein
MASDDRTLEQRVQDELTPINMEDRFNEMLDECYSFDSVGGPFAHMQPSRVLLELDPIAHRCGVNDYADSISRDRDIEEIDGEFYQAEEVQAIRDEIEAEAEAEAVPACGEIVSAGWLCDQTRGHAGPHTNEKLPRAWRKD